MKPSAAFITVLFLLLLLPQFHGIRMGKRLTFVQDDEAQHKDQVVEARRSNRVSEANIDDGYEGVHYSCENTQCEGKKRKLLITATATTSSSSSSSSSRGHGKAEFSASSSTTEFEGYHDVIDIAEMDYSPAKRKPPIHN